MEELPSWWWCFFGKDPTKVDRSSLRFKIFSKKYCSCRCIEKCLIQLAYAIGVSKPLSIFIKLADKDNSKVDKLKIIEDNFNLSPRGIRNAEFEQSYIRNYLCLRSLWKKAYKKVNLLGKNR